MLNIKDEYAKYASRNFYIITSKHLNKVCYVTAPLLINILIPSDLIFLIKWEVKR